MKKIYFLLMAALLIVPAAAQADEGAKLNERLDISATAFRELMESSDSSIPDSLLHKAEAIVIFPRTLNLAWGIGGQYGRGVALRRNTQTGEWSAPAFYSIGGITLGPQIGGQAIDTVLVVTNEKGLNSLLKSKCTLGGDAGIAVGPAGRNATASTDIGLKAEIYSYSRAKGLYIGLSLKGAIVSPDKSANEEFYGAGVTAAEILSGKVGHRGPDSKLMKAVRHYAPERTTPVRIILWALAILAIAGAIALFARRAR